MDLKQIYRPIEKDFKKLEMMLKATLRGRNSRVIFEINKFLLGSGGKKLRPAMVFLAAGAVARTAAARDPDQKLVDLAAAVELVHRASLIHDDVIDRAQLRHSQPTLNHRWGQDVAIAAGDYFYAEAFRLIAACGNFKVIDCMGAATKLMCEGELNQICERGNVGLRKRQYLGMVQKKTAALFSASCEAGAVLAGADVRHQKALKDYGFNFGIAFQVRDDYLDLVGEEEVLGKVSGADFHIGEWTLPIFNLLADAGDTEMIMKLMRQSDRPAALKEVRRRFLNSRAQAKTRKEVNDYVAKAKKSMHGLKGSSFKDSLIALADGFSV